MGSAIGNVLGGGGGGLLGSIGGIVGGIFGGPIGSMIGQALGNMVQSAVGDATKQAVDTLQKEHGMPKFLAEQVKDKIGDIIDSLTDKSVDAGAQSQVNENTRGARDEFVNDLASEIVKLVKDNMQAQADGAEGGGSSKAKGSKGSGSWLEAIAKAMGQTLGKKAEKMVELSDKIANTAGGTGKAAAKANTEATLEMQGVSQMFNLMQNAFAGAVKAIGEGLAQAARKG